MTARRIYSLIIIEILLLALPLADTASSCYACNPCGTSWNPSRATIIQTSNPNDFCRKTVTGSLVTRDSGSSCTPVNVVNNGVYCCQTDFCNASSALKFSLGYSFLFFYLIDHLYF